ncbi:MAG: Hsp33 family molecular chaperone HslO [Clostridia bacterium]|nr:Hsp33 family molecular chaperone HslO [Clostridia bacterium]MBQ6558165.1 Hsp33 family molecular chaperone HslO [Clostridia bacterium]
MADKLVRGNSDDGAIRVFAAITTDLVNEAQRIHKTYPVATAALGRLLTGAAIMGAATLKNDTDSLTLQIKGEGDIKDLVAVTDSQSRVRGYISNPYIDRPLNKEGKLDVGGAVGQGYLSVIRDLGMREPYIGQIPLVSGEIADDLTYYYAKSEQIPTSVALGVLVDTDGSVLAAGGFMIQLMPEATEEMAEELEKLLKEVPPVTKMIRDGLDAEDILFEITYGFSMLCENKFIVPKYECKCTRERMERALISIGKDELRSLIDEQGSAEMTCRFCDNKYNFTKEELEELLRQAKR